jgi:hypothetical protein
MYFAMISSREFVECESMARRGYGGETKKASAGAPA